MRSLDRAFVLPALVLLAFALQVAAQSGNQGSIEGMVTDLSGAVIPGTTVKARNLNTSIAFSVISDSDGLFRFPVLSLGTYELIAERLGFATLTLKDVVVTVGARINLTLSLRIAGKLETVTVSGQTPVVETTRSQVSTVVDSRAIASLPVNGRDFTNFILLTPGVTRDVRGGLSFAGQRAMNSLLVDGDNNDDTYWGQPLGGTGFTPGGTYHISQEAVQEFQANANSYSAEFGRAGGGVINAVTRSGTNELHGSAYWFYRDRSMNANDPVNKLNRLPKDPYHFNQLGGALGGPILKSRLFFFANYEGLRSATPNAIFLGLPKGFQLSSNQTVAGFQQLAFDYLRPRAASWVRPLAQDDYLAKLDWKISQVHLLTGRWNRQSFTGAGPGDVNPQNSFEHTSPAPVNTDTIDLSLTSTISSTMINVIRFGYVGSSIAFAAESANPEASIFEGGQLVLTIGRESGSPQDSLIHRGQWSDTFSYHRGRHTLRTGADLLLDRITFFIAKSFSGSYTFNSLESFGRSLAGAPGPCMGLPCPGDSYQQAFSGSGTPGSITHPNIVAIAGFVQDEWRLKPRLTLNIGARYDLQVTARPPVKNPSSALEAAGLDTSSLATDKDNFAPRLGLAWAPLRNGHLVVRAGYGIFYGLTPSVLTARAHFQNGISVQTRTFSGGTASAVLTPSYPNNFCGPPDPSGVPPTCAPPATGASSPTLQLFSSRYTQPYVQQASLGFEVRVQKDVGVSVSYLLARGTHLQRIRDVNLGTPTTSATIGIANTSTELAYQKFTLPRPIAGFDRILLFESNANSIYHGLALQVNKRFSNNLQFLASYTLGKVIDDNPNVYALSTSPSNPLLLSDPSNPRGERGPGSNDQRHRLVLSGVWELNYGRSLPSEARAILGGWQLSGILTAQSGQPYSGLVRFDLNNDGDFATDRTPGLGRNTFYLPATISFDPRVTRNVVLRERLRLQFIWEAFNVLNHANIAAVRTTQYVRSASPAVCGIASASCLVPQSFGVNAFGIPFQSFGPRIMQLAVKVSF